MKHDEVYLISEQNMKKLMNSRNIVSRIIMMAPTTVNWVYFLETWLTFSNNLVMMKQRKYSFLLESCESQIQI